MNSELGGNIHPNISRSKSMEPILQDLSPASLVAAIKSNFYDSFRRLKDAPQTEYDYGPGFERWHTLIPHPWFNGVLASFLPADGVHRLIQENLAFFNEHAVSAHSWWLAPSIQHEAWGPHLAAFGYQYSDDPPGMAIDLDRLPVSVPHPVHLVIQEIHDQPAFESWSQVFMRGYGLPDLLGGELLAMYASMGLELPSRYYLATLDGQPVGTSRLFLGSGVAGIYNVATLPQARGQGIGGALTLMPLHQARSMGYRAGVLQSSEMGFRLYQRLGFEKLCNIDHYFWTAGQND
jgi:ribosomal protein S18 acetylase RimI-like enzyme